MRKSELATRITAILANDESHQSRVQKCFTLFNALFADFGDEVSKIPAHYDAAIALVEDWDRNPSRRIPTDADKSAAMSIVFDFFSPWGKDAEGFDIPDEPDENVKELIKAVETAFGDACREERSQEIIDYYDDLLARVKGGK